MQEPDSLNPIKFLSHVGRSLCFALPTGVVLWVIYLFIQRLTSGCRMTAYDSSTDTINMGFLLVLNCFLAALNPLLFCLFELWWCWHQMIIGHLYGDGGLFRFGVVPLVIAVIVSIKKGWIRHSSETRSQTIRKISITSALCLVLIPFESQILSAPTNISNSFRLLTLTKKIAEKPPSPRNTTMSRTLAKTLGEAGKPNQAMNVLLGVMHQDLKDGGGDSLSDDFWTLEYIDPASALTKEEWLILRSPVNTILNAALIKSQNNEPGYNLEDLPAYQLTRALVSQDLRHGATAEALNWQKIAEKYRRLKYGDVWSHNSHQLAQTAHDCQLDDEALAILQSSIALAESDCANKISTGSTERSATLHSNMVDKELALYEKIVTALPANSWHRQNLPAWKNSRALHERAYCLMNDKNYQAAESFLLEAQAFDINDTSCARAWSIYQNLLGTVELKLEKTAEAERHYKLALQNDLLAAQGGPESADVARDLGYLALLYQKQGKLADADKLLCQALEMDRQILGDFALETKAMEANVIAFNTSQQRYKENELLYKQAIRKAEERQKPDTVQIERINKLANFYIERNDYLRAEEQLARAFKVSQDTGSFTKPTIANLDKLGDCYLSQSDYTKAAKQYERGYQLADDRYSFNSDKALRLDKFTKLYIAQKDFVKAADTARTALWIRRKNYAPALDIQKNEAEYLALLKKTTGRD